MSGPGFLYQGRGKFFPGLASQAGRAERDLPGDLARRFLSAGSFSDEMSAPKSPPVESTTHKY